MSTHHTLDIHPIPGKVIYINEPQLADHTALNYEHTHNPKEQSEDNIRVYVPLDLSRDAILRRLRDIYNRYGGTPGVRHPKQGIKKIKRKSKFDESLIKSKLFLIRTVDKYRGSRHSCFPD